MLSRLRLPARWQAAPVVPVVRLSGVIGSSASWRGGGLGLHGLASVLERAFKLRHAKAVALAINSPGGSPVQSALIAERIRTLAREHELPVLAFIEDVGASGGYWLALAADEIFAIDTSLVGSIGVIHGSFGFSEALQRLGVERRVYTAGRDKGMLDPFQPLDPEDVARLRTILEDVHAAFKAEVRARRGERLTAADAELFEGQVWTGRRAVELGLIDGLGSLHAVLKARFGDKVRMPQVGTTRRWWQRRLGLAAAPAAEPREWIDAALDSLAERALWARFGL
jgi:serine protease SohB